MERTNFAWLFVGLIGLLAVAPLVQTDGAGGSVALEAAFTSLLLVGAWSLRHEGRGFVAALALGGLNLAALSGFLVSGNPVWSSLATLALLVFCVLSAFVAMRFILANAEIDANHLLGALSVYLLLGVIWALLYELLRQIDPSALANLDLAPGQPGTTGELLYFSYVTLTTLGYGDVTPVSAVARNLAVLEAVVGQLFLAVLIASLIGRIRPRSG